MNIDLIREELTNRDKAIMIINDATVEKRDAEWAIIGELIDGKYVDCLSINWSRVRRLLRDSRK